MTDPRNEEILADIDDALSDYETQRDFEAAAHDRRRRFL
jgi:hypothetical protein